MSSMSASRRAAAARILIERKARFLGRYYMRYVNDVTLSKVEGHVRSIKGIKSKLKLTVDGLHAGHRSGSIIRNKVPTTFVALKTIHSLQVDPTCRNVLYCAVKNPDNNYEVFTYRLGSTTDALQFQHIFNEVYVSSITNIDSNTREPDSLFVPIDADRWRNGPDNWTLRNTTKQRKGLPLNYQITGDVKYGLDGTVTVDNNNEYGGSGLARTNNQILTSAQQGSSWAKDGDSRQPAQNGWASNANTSTIDRQDHGQSNGHTAGFAKSATQQDYSVSTNTYGGSRVPVQGVASSSGVYAASDNQDGNRLDIEKGLYELTKEVKHLRSMVADQHQLHDQTHGGAAIGWARTNSASSYYPNDSEVTGDSGFTGELVASGNQVIRARATDHRFDSNRVANSGHSTLTNGWKSESTLVNRDMGSGASNTGTTYHVGGPGGYRGRTARDEIMSRRHYDSMDRQQAARGQASQYVVTSIPTTKEEATLTRGRRAKRSQSKESHRRYPSETGSQHSMTSTRTMPNYSRRPMEGGYTYEPLNKPEFVLVYPHTQTIHRPRAQSASRYSQW